MMISSYLFIIKMPLFLFWGNKYQKHNTQKEDKYFYRLPYKLLSKSLVSAHSFRKQCILKLSFIHVRFMDQSTPTHQGPLMLDVVALANRAGPQKWRHVDVISAGPALLDFYVFWKPCCHRVSAVLATFTHNALANPALYLCKNTT